MTLRILTNKSLRGQDDPRRLLEFERRLPAVWKNASNERFSRFRWKLMRARRYAVRWTRKLRNLLIEPPPRSSELLYEGYDLAYPEIAFHFRVHDHSYTHHVVLDDLTKETFEALAEEHWRPLMHHIGLLFAPFHFRLRDFASVRSTCWPLPADMRQFYEDLAIGGLGEFRYLQGLDPRRRVTFCSDLGMDVPPPSRVPLQDKVLVLNGGGKDSIVAAELFKAMGVPFAWFTARMNDTRARVIVKSGVSEAYSAGFRLDPALESHATYPWANTPIIGLISSLALIPATLHRFRFVAIGSEYSANFPTRLFRGMEINHQYGKSYSFETQLADLIQRRLVENVTYFSVLRPFYELRLAALFSRFDAYLDAFISCNVGLGRGRWCKACPKCAFVFLILYPFLDANQLQRVFGENLFHRQRIRVLMLDLAGRGSKPWECVGTPEESQLALYLSLRKSPALIFPEWPRREDLERACRGFDALAAVERYLHGFHSPHRVPSEFEARLRSVADELDPACAV